MVEDAKENWAAGIYTSEEAYGTLQLNAEAIGKLSALKALQEIEYEDLAGV